MLGDITTDSLTTYEYYRFWKDFSGNLATANVSVVASYPSIFFVSAVAIWMLTPLVYTIGIGVQLSSLLFNWEMFKQGDDDTFYSRQMIRFLRIFNLTPEEVNSYPTSLKIVIVIPPFGIVVFITLKCYSTFLAYVQFPLFAITVALKDVYKTLPGGCKVKLDQVVKKSKTKSNRISKAKAICGLGIFYEDDIVEMKSTEAMFESFYQFLLSSIFFFLTKKYDLEGNILVENVFIPDNAILLSSMIMSMGSIMIAINGWLIKEAKLKHGKDFYKNICSTSMFGMLHPVLFNLMLASVLLCGFILVVVM